MNRFGLTVFILLAQASIVLSQGVSIGDVARSERDRRKQMEVSRDQLVKDLLQHSGATTFMEQMARTFSDSVGTQFNQFPPEMREHLKASAIESFKPSKLMPTFERTFATEMDNVSLVEVSRWYETPIGTKVLQAETQGSGKAAANVPNAEVSDDRARLIEQLDTQTQGTERMVAALAAMTKAMLAKMLQSSSASQRTQDLFLLGFEQSFTQNATPKMRPFLIASYTNAYRSLSDDELQEYIRFLASAAGRRYVRAGWDAFQSAMEQGGTDTGTRFSEILKQRN
jgi:hypothetical protein